MRFYVKLKEEDGGLCVWLDTDPDGEILMTIDAENTDAARVRYMATFEDETGRTFCRSGEIGADPLGL